MVDILKNLVLPSTKPGMTISLDIGTTFRLYLKQTLDEDGNDIHDDVRCVCLRFESDLWEIESIRGIDEKDIDHTFCTIPGKILMKWIVDFICVNRIKNIELVDVAEVHIPGTKRMLNLTRLRKFTQKQGWYESFGFVTTDPYEKKKY